MFITEIQKSTETETILSLVNIYTSTHNLPSLPENRAEWRKLAYTDAVYSFIKTDAVVCAALRQINAIRRNNNIKNIDPQIMEFSEHEVDLLLRAGEYTYHAEKYWVMDTVTSTYDEDGGVFVSKSSPALLRVAQLSAISVVDMVRPLLHRVAAMIANQQPQRDCFENIDQNTLNTVRLTAYSIKLTAKEVHILQTFSGAIAQWIFVYFERDIDREISAIDDEYYGTDEQKSEHNQLIQLEHKNRHALDIRVYKKLCDKLMDI